MPYAPLPGGGGILPAVSGGGGGGVGGGCRPVLLGGVDLSMSAAVQQPSANAPQGHIPHPASSFIGAPPSHPAGFIGALPPAVHMPRSPDVVLPLGPSLPAGHHREPDSDAPPNPDVLLSLLARNKHLEGKK